MPSFRVVARDRSGATVRAIRDAVSDGVLLTELRGEGLLPLAIEEQSSATRASSARSWFGPTQQDVEIELRQIAFMVKSGVTLLQAIYLCSQQRPGRRMSRVMDDVAFAIREGSSLTDALRRHKCFDALTCSLVEVGEQGGNLDVVLARAADILERRRFLRTQMITALIYPALVILMAIGTVAYMMVGVIPKLAKFLSSLGRRLPPSTQLLVDISDFMRTYFVDGMIALGLLAATVWVMSRTERGRAIIDAVLVRVPIVGRILDLVAVSGFAYNLALLVRSGVRITQGLEIVEPILPLPRQARRLARSREFVTQGLPLSESLGRHKTFDPLVVGMVAVGESSGRLDEVLEHVAEFHDSRLRELVRRLGTIIEPIILVVIGVVVGFVYLSFFAAVYSFAGKR